jgi:hypothetical protein
MSQIITSHLKAGYIFGDHAANEYVYLPAGEFGADDPMCVFESIHGRQDVRIDEAVQLILRLTLQRVKHPHLGAKSC